MRKKITMISLKSEKYFRKKSIFLSKKMIEKMLKFVLEREKFLIDFYIS